MKRHRTPLPLRVGAALRKRREALRISQERFAEVVQMHRTYYSELERGKKNMQIETLERVAIALKARAWEILKEADS